MSDTFENISMPEVFFMPEVLIFFIDLKSSDEIYSVLTTTVSIRTLWAGCG